MAIVISDDKLTRHITEAETRIFPEKRQLAIQRFGTVAEAMDYVLSKNGFQEKIAVVVVDYSPANTFQTNWQTLDKATPESMKIIRCAEEQYPSLAEFFPDDSHHFFLLIPHSPLQLQLTFRQAVKSFLEQKAARSILEGAALGSEIQKETPVNVNPNKIISVIAHDLKDPLLAVTGITDLLMSNWKQTDEEEKLAILKDVHYTAETTYKLLADLVKWSKRQIDNPTPNFQRFPVERVISEVITITRQRARWKNISMVNAVTPGIELYADENMVSTIFRNLITNAIKSTRSGGKVEIHAKSDGEMCQFCISDTGVGMTSAQMEQLFGSHRKAGNHSLGNAHSSNGLGLMLCKDFIETNHGQVWAESEPGKGSRIFFSLPLSY